MSKHTEPMMRDDALKGKTILITGGGTGLGKAMGTYFLKLGANLVITSRKLDRLEATAKEMEAETGGKVLALQSDVRNAEEVETVLDKAIAEFGQIDVLVNNAAGNFISPTERLSSGAFAAVIGIVLQGTVNYTLALGKRWIENGQAGNMLNIVTTYAWTGSGYVVPSATAKAGVLALTRSLAVEWGPKNIRMNAIAPGLFPTKGSMDRLMPGDIAEKFSAKNKVPLGRIGDQQEIANLAAYLVSDYAGFVNGEVVTLDGGEWMKGAGQFSFLENVTPDMWDMLEQMTRNAK